MTHKRDIPCDGSNDRCPLDLVKKTHAPAIVEHIHYDPSGNPKTVEVHCYPIFDGSGKLTHVIEYSLDITARKQMQETLEKAKSRAEDASRLKSEFLANVSHEIRTPLNSIIGFSELLKQEESFNAEQKDFADTIMNNGYLLLNLINDILDLSKIEAAKMELEISDVDLRSLKKNIEGIIRPLADKKNVTFTIDCAEDMPAIIRTDRLRLQQCLMNLASNAVKFADHKSVDIRFDTEEILGKQFIRIDVKDTGIGIDESKLEIIFDAFIQADGSTTRKFGGTGLGLTITRKLVSMLGGELFVTSKVGKGSVFSIQLPLEPSDGTEQEAGICETEAMETSVPETDECD